jgi:tRNA A58 N-methylase Trm61
MVANRLFWIAEGDRVVVQGKTPFLTKPLQRGKKIGTRRGDVEHGDIIGKATRTVVQSHKGKPFLHLFRFWHRLTLGLAGQKFRVSYPTLDEYVTLTPRLVTPVSSRPSRPFRAYSAVI